MEDNIMTHLIYRNITMKNNFQHLSFLMILLLAIITSCCQRRVVEYADYEKTQILYEFHQNIFGQLYGPFIEYRDNGNKHREGNYKKNLLDGDYYEYYHDGTLKIHAQYKEGLFWNIITYQDEEKTPFDFGDFKDGNGNITIYAPEGQLRAEGNYVDGKPDGPWKFYSNAGYSHTDIYCKDNLKGKTTTQNIPPCL
jgi:antitoxin component YwqK of YwqJK toxin-antitoxin module